MRDQVTARALANMLGVSKKAISALAKSGVIAPVGRGHYALQASVNSYCAYLRAMAAAHGDRNAFSIQPKKQGSSRGSGT
jgi:hypothetical protein